MVGGNATGSNELSVRLLGGEILLDLLTKGVVIAMAKKLLTSFFIYLFTFMVKPRYCSGLVRILISSSQTSTAFNSIVF